MKTIAIVGATGAVGEEIIKVLEKRNFPYEKIILLASAQSAGKTLLVNGQKIVVEELTEESFHNVDIAIFSAGGNTSLKFAPIAAKSGCVVIDNSNAFRMDPAVPLVVPEINPEAISSHKGIIANPNCTTIVTMMALWPLHKKFKVKRIFASSYQAVSGSGAKAIEELKRQVGEIEKGEEVTKNVYPYQIAFNVLPQVESFLESGYTKEEMKMQNEGRKIMNHPEFLASVTCVRVPVYRSHSIAVSAEFEKPVTVEEGRAVLLEASGIEVVDDISKNIYPTPLAVSGKDNCQVGRIRKDVVFDNGLSFWVVGDQLLKGAALNAVQIAEMLMTQSI